MFGFFRKLFLFILCCLFFSMQVDSSPCRDAVNGKRKVVLSFETAVSMARSAGLSTIMEFRAWRKDHPDMPSAPDIFYREKWQSWEHFLGVEKVSDAVWRETFFWHRWRSFDQFFKGVTYDYDGPPTIKNEDKEID